MMSIFLYQTLLILAFLFLCLLSLFFWFYDDTSKIKKEIKSLNTRVVNAENIKDASIDILNERFSNLESYVTDLERKIIDVHTSIEMMKAKENKPAITHKEKK